MTDYRANFFRTSSALVSFARSVPVGRCGRGIDRSRRLTFGQQRNAVYVASLRSSCVVYVVRFLHILVENVFVK